MYKKSIIICLLLAMDLQIESYHGGGGGGFGAGFGGAFVGSMAGSAIASSMANKNSSSRDPYAQVDEYKARKELKEMREEERQERQEERQCQLSYKCHLILPHHVVVLCLGYFPKMF